MIPNKAAYMDDEPWVKVVKVVAPGIIKMKLSNVAYVLPILFYIYMYITLHVYPSKLSEDGI